PVVENVTDKQREKQKYSRLYAAKAMTVPASINVVGKNLDEAVMEVEKYLDDAFIASLETVSVIHGRGAGILREGIARMLRSNRHVESFRKGGQGEGGDGVTIVKIKR
ncbi:MAG TPA: Smr/MutS family protein, partial [Bacillota bacterium]|nr:Smr/MutS family protein [Bacillota bacterium]